MNSNPNYILYLASGSFSRKRLLELSKIPFQLVKQDADESQCSMNQPLEILVKQLAELKMKHVIMPVYAQEGDICFVLTADTLTLDTSQQLFGKPKDRDDAKRMLIACRQGAIVGTAFCLERKLYTKGKWRTQERILDYDRASCIVDVPNEFMNFYLDKVPFADVSGGITIEGFGEQFVKEVNGNYSAIIGLPMYKVREALYKLGFYENL